MIQTLHDSTGNFEWIDLIDPTLPELEQVIAKYELPADRVKSCLDPDHLPIFEEIPNGQFILVRAADLATYSLKEADTILELTRKIALFTGPKFLISVHRSKLPFLDRVETKVPNRAVTHPYRILAEILHGALSSYEAPLAHAENAFEVFEKLIFDGNSQSNIIKDIYFLKRKISIYKRMIRMTIDVIFKMHSQDAPKMELRYIREEADRMLYFSDELEGDVAHLLDSHLSISANRTNDIVRVLTLFSVFFMPLTFIVGVYGMNFKFLPELQWEWGYAGVWGVMLVTCVVIFLWFKKKGWLQS